MTNPILAPELLELLNSENRDELLEAVNAVHPAEMAEFVAALDDPDVWRLLQAIPRQQAAEIFSNFDFDRQEDVEKLMAISGRHQAGEYLRTGALVHFKNRVGWVVILGLLGLVSGLIVQNYEGLLMQFAILAAFMPMLADTGGNTGSQSATLVVRALALEEVRPRDFLRVLFKELKVSVLLALVLAFVAFGRVLVFGGGSTMPEGSSLNWIGLAISIALGLQVVSATMTGAILPLLAAKLKLDPAIVASPALTTIVDITGLLLFFGTAKILLGV
ncbi:MAG: hypothetical protein GXY44_13255 [Phycisphaerales bacterium]|nr:hypothetical protein [Phycisphaerales bacterium]